MKVYLGTCDGGGFYQDCMVIVGRKFRLTRMPARMVQLTGRVCFSFFWDGIGGKSKNSMGVERSSLKRNSL
jgi:hypothetical protein